MTAAKTTIARHPELPGITAEFVFADPPLAQKWLDGAAPNRPQRERSIDAHVRDITTGSWLVTGATIVLDAQDRMIDGQHRCEAIAAAGQGIWVLLVRGVDTGAQKVIDTGNARNVADHLALAGVSYGPVVAAIARRILLWEANGSEGGYAGIKPTHSEILDTYQRCPEISDAARFAYHARDTAPDLKKILTSVWGVAWWLFTRLDVETGEFFLDRVLSGVAESEGAPWLAFRRRIHRATADGERLSEAEQLYLLVTAWNKFRGNEEASRLQLPRGGAARTSIPKPY